MRLLATFIIIVYTLTACGLKGPLYLPPEGDANSDSTQKTKKK
ncbi:MAG: lipoprotein [Nitrosomonas sp.]